jgi:uncharacterized protein
MGDGHDERVKRVSHDGLDEYEVPRSCEEEECSQASQDETFAAILQTYMSRRTLLKVAMTSLVLASVGPWIRPSGGAGSEGFVPLTHSTEDKLLVPEGYQFNVIIRWGDPVLPDTPAFDPRA